MPEYAEVKIIVNNLNKEFSSQTLHNVEVVGGKFLKTGIQGLRSVKFPLHNVRFNASGKFIYWSFDEEPIVFNHLGMAANFGQKSKHSAIKFEFDKDVIYFNDIRHFGNFKFGFNQELQQKLASLGWDLMKPVPADIAIHFRKFNNKTLAEAMMNQSLLNGAGNYLKSESCYDAKINPMRMVSSLSDAEILRLCQSLQSVVKRAYEVGGATIATFKDMYGNTGKFFDEFKVYRRKTDPLGNPVIRVQTRDKRSTYYVKEVQL